MKSMALRIATALFVWCLLMVGLAGGYFWHWLHLEVRVPTAQQVFVVERGAGLGAIAQKLHHSGLLRWPHVWRLYARLFQPETVKAGEYALAAFESPVGLLTRLQGGDVISYNVTFAEGLTLEEWLNILGQIDKLEQKAQSMSLRDIATYLGTVQENPEGLFFPDTYRFEKGDSDLDILRRAHERMKKELANQWARRQPSLPYKSPYDVVIMASIIEKETGIPSERRDIAGVFVRRLQKGMRLQTDPTVIYGMGDRYKGKIRKSDLTEPTPYNTYVINGLPPTPIASPGREALAAAVNPAKGDALFFVAKGDGSHQFSKTLEEHNRAVKQYQLQRRSDYRSSPTPE